MKLEPLGDRVVVERLEAEGVSEGGIFLPETSKEKPQRGLLIAVGKGKLAEDGKKLLPMLVAVGDEVVFSRHSGSEFEVDGREFLVMPAGEILAILRP